MRGYTITDIRESLLLQLSYVAAPDHSDGGHELTLAGICKPNAYVKSVSLTKTFHNNFFLGCLVYGSATRVVLATMKRFSIQVLPSMTLKV